MADPKRTRAPAMFDGAFADLDVLPELQGKTVAALARGATGLRIYCRACGRDVLVTPAALRRYHASAQAWTIERLVRAVTCSTCGAREGQASGWPLEPEQLKAGVIVRRAHHGGPRLDRKR